MSWFTRSTVPDETSELLLDALGDVLAHLEAQQDEPPARLVRLRERLARPPVPSGLRRELGAVLEQVSHQGADLEDDTPTVVAEMASALVDALDASSLLDADLVTEISGLEEQVPARVGRGDARRLTREAGRIREVALPARERAQRSRQEVARLVTELSSELTPGLRHATALDWGLGELGDTLAGVNEPEALATVRQEMTSILRELSGNSSAVRARMAKAMEHTRALEAELADAREKVARLEARSERDALTGLFDRGAFDRRLLEAIAERSGQRAGDDEELCLVVLDIDHFKRINDTWGHPVGDEVLRCVSDTIRQQVRGDDVVGRLGGEEFGVLLRSAPLHDALEVVERIRVAVSQQHHEPSELRVTLSAGVAVHVGTETALALYKRADRALYDAKEQGRDRFVLAA